MISRRTFLKYSAQAGLTAALAPNILSAIANPLEGSAVAPQALRIPSVITGGDLSVAAGTLRVFPDADTNLLMVNNSFPSPTIKLKKGDTFSATIHNSLSEPTVMHWHGIHAPARMSGHPMDAVDAGSSYSVNFPIVQRAGIAWYHPHPHMATGPQVYMGLAGFFLVEDDEELAMGLPTGEYDVPLMIQDKRVDANRQFLYDMNQVDMMSGWLGETIMVNGTPNPYLEVAPTLYRFRIVNASNSRFYKLALSDNKSFTIIGNDGGFLDAPVSLSVATLAPAERLDILVDFSSYTQGQTVTLKSLKFTFSDAPGTGSVPQGAEMNLIEFRVAKSGATNGIIPATLPAITPYRVQDAKREREWTFAAMHHINDQSYDMMRIDGHVPFGELESWTFESEAANTHPVHVHGAHFQVVDRDGNPPEPYERGWKDIIRLDPLGKVKVLIKFDQYDGEFVIHCHKLEHADAGMMANFVVDKQERVTESEAENASLRITPNPATDYAHVHFQALGRSETLQVVDTKGAVVHSALIPAGTDYVTLQTSTLPAGTYHITLGTLGARLVIVSH